MRKVKRIMACLLALVMLVGLTAGCGNGKEGSQPGNSRLEGSQSDSSQPESSEAQSQEQSLGSDEKEDLPYVKLNCYIVGSLPAQSDLVLENLNSMLKEEINAELDISELSWGDYSSKYSLVLAGGENIDLIYTSNWCFFLPEAKKNAFMALDGLVEQYAPNAFAEIPEEAWNDAKVNGNTYMLPMHYTSLNGRSIVYREDLRKKYNVPEIKEFEDLNAYYEAIKANEPDMYPLHATLADLENLFLAYMWEQEGYRSTTLGKGLVASADDSTATILPLYETDSYRKWAEIARDWYQKGYWSTDVLSNKTTADKAFLNGTSASACIQYTASTGIFSANTAEANEGWELGVLELTHNGKYPQTPYNQNGMAIPSTSKNPERALMAYDLLSTDKEFYDAHVYGIKDVTYVVDENGAYAYPPDYVSGEGYSFGGLGLKMGMNNLKLNNDSAVSAREEYITYVLDYEAPKKYGLPMVIEGTPFDTDGFSSELVTFQDVYSTYSNLLATGIDDTPVETQLENFKNEAEAAGIQKILEDANRQKDEFLKSIQ